MNIGAHKLSEIYFYFFVLLSLFVNFVTIDGAAAVFWKDNRCLRTYPRTSRAVSFAIGRIDNFNFSLLRKLVYAKKTKVQTLFAVLTAVVVDYREPRYPVTSFFQLDILLCLSGSFVLQQR